MVSWLFNYPTDVIKTRFQTDLSYTSYWDCIRKTYAENGWRSFSVGLGSTLLRAFPSNAATFFVVEWTYRLMLDSKVIEEQHSGSNKKGKKESSILLGGTDHGHQHQLVNMKQSAPYIRMYDLWHRNSFLLPEAGSTFIDPMLHGRRFRPEPTPQGTPIDPMIHGSRFI
uniref:Uncharacterized protein n=1 Tax=Plectus sambesii TaxID=2011161 RepID=A0A914W6H5_9BILA